MDTNKKIKKSNEKVTIAIIKTEKSSPIQEVMCKETYKKLFDALCERKKPL